MEKKTFVLVHGAFQEGSTWDQVVPELEKAGHTAIAVNLPGRGDDPSSLGEITLEDYRNAVIDVINRQKGTIVLVGHSFGGITITEVAEAIPDNIEKLVYVAAYLPENSQSLSTLAMMDEHNGFNENNFLMAADFSYAEVRKDDVVDIFSADANESVKEMMLDKMIKEPLGPMNTPVSVTSGNFGRVRKVYIKTSKDNAISPQLQDMMLSKTPVNNVYELDTSHVPFYTMPEKLVELLLKDE